MLLLQLIICHTCNCYIIRFICKLSCSSNIMFFILLLLILALCFPGTLNTLPRSTWRNTMWGIGLEWLLPTRTAMCMSYVTSTSLRMRVKRKTEWTVDLVLCLFFDLACILKDVISAFSSGLYCSRVLSLLGAFALIFIYPTIISGLSNELLNLVCFEPSLKNLYI